MAELHITDIDEQVLARLRERAKQENRPVEEGSKRVQQWFQKGPVVATSSLALIEVMTTLVRKERGGELATDDMDTSLNLVEADYDRFATVPLSNGVTDRAWILSRRYGLRGADTIHLAAAQ